jgi:flagella basal body P-ring formation protein FlgA
MFSLKSKKSLMLVLICTLTLIGMSQSQAKPGDEQMLMQGIRQHIEKNMNHPAENMRVEFCSVLPKLDNLPGKVTFSIDSRSREEYLGDTSVAVRIFSNGIFVREENVRVRIEVLKDFVVSTSNIAKDTIVSEGDIMVQQKWVRSIPLNGLSSIDEALGKMTAVNVRSNIQLTRHMLKEVMPVKKGKMVQVILDNGAMKMMTSGIAEEDGAEDAMVKIRNTNSNKVIYARVIGHGKVQVDF